MPDFYLMMDIVRPVESFAMWPQMITQEHVPDALYLHDWWLPDVCLGESRKRYHFDMFLSNTTPWSSGEGRHMVYKRWWCSWRGQIKHRASGTPHFDSHHLCFLCSVPDHEDWFPAYQRQKSREKREARLFPSWPELSLWSTQILTKPFAEITVSIAAGTDAALRSYTSPCKGMFRWWGQGCCQLVRVLPCMKGMAQLQGQAGLKGPSHCSSGFLIASLCL